MQPCQGIAWWAHRDDDRQRGNVFLALLSKLIGSKDPDALKIPARRAEYSLTESASSPVQAEPSQLARNPSVLAHNALCRFRAYKPAAWSLFRSSAINSTLRSSSGPQTWVSFLSSVAC